MLLVIDIQVIRELAIAASIGVAVLIFTNLILLPILLSYTGVSARAAERSLRAAAVLGLQAFDDRDAVGRALSQPAEQRLLFLRVMQPLRVGLDIEQRGAHQLRIGRRAAGAVVKRLLQGTQHRGQRAVLVAYGTQRALLDERDRLRAEGHPPLESDLKPTNRFLMERFIHGGVSLRGAVTKRDGVLNLKDPQVRAADVTPTLRPLSLDIETDGWDGPVLSIALAGAGLEHVFLAREGVDAPHSVSSSPRAVSRHSTESRNASSSGPFAERGRPSFGTFPQVG